MPFCKKCGAEIIDEGFLGYCGLNCMGDLSPGQKTSKSNISVQSSIFPVTSLDYHRLPLFEAKNKLVDDVIEVFETGADEIRIIHGFKHGQAIKAYIWRKNGFLKEIKALRSDIKLKLFAGPSRAITIIRFQK